MLCCARVWRTGLAALLLVGLAFAALAPAPPVAATNGTKAGRTKLTITVPIDVILMPGVEPGAVETLRDGFDHFWGEANDFHYQCRDVVLKLDLNVVAEGELPPSDAPRHRVILRHAEDPQDVSFVHAGSPTQWQSYDPSEDSIEGVWDDWDDAATYAHEMGHLLGLRDEYTFEDKNGNGRRDKDEPSKPLPGMGNSLMADHGKVHQRYIDEIVKKHFDAKDLKCKLHAVQEIDHEHDLGFQRGTQHVVLEVWATTADDGTLTGQATYVAEGEASHDTACDGGFTANAWTGEGVGLVVSGRREGDHVELVVAGEFQTVTVLTEGLCTGTFENTQPLAWLLPLKGDLVGGRFEDEQTLTPGEGQTLHVWTLIEELPDEQRGEPVG